MSLQAFFEVSSSWIDPKHVGLSPFYDAKEKRMRLEPPGIPSSFYEYTMCTKRAINTQIIGFAEPTLRQCVNELTRNIQASSIVQDKMALKEVLQHRRGAVNPAALPWSPRPEYLDWLRREGRLAE